jgi:hypothetical protein
MPEWCNTTKHVGTPDRPDPPRATIAIVSAGASLLLPVQIGQIGVIAVVALIGWRFLRSDVRTEASPIAVPTPRWLSVTACLCPLVPVRIAYHEPAPPERPFTPRSEP